MKFTKKMTDSSKLILSLILMKTMSAFFILHQFLGTVQQTMGAGGGGADVAERCIFTRFCSNLKKMLYLLLFYFFYTYISYLNKVMISYNNMAIILR